MSKFDDFTDAVLLGAKDLARDVFDGFEDQARDDTRAFLDKTKNDLQRWTTLLSDNELSEQDFQDLLEAKKANIEIHALTRQGIALTKAERFRSGLIELVLDKAIGVFL